MKTSTDTFRCRDGFTYGYTYHDKKLFKIEKFKPNNENAVEINFFYYDVRGVFIERERFIKNEGKKGILVYCFKAMKRKPYELQIRTIYNNGIIMEVERFKPNNLSEPFEVQCLDEYRDISNIEHKKPYKGCNCPIWTQGIFPSSNTRNALHWQYRHRELELEHLSNHQADSRGSSPKPTPSKKENVRKRSESETQRHSESNHRDSLIRRRKKGPLTINLP